MEGSMTHARWAGDQSVSHGNIQYSYFEKHLMAVINVYAMCACHHSDIYQLPASHDKHVTSSLDFPQVWASFLAKQ